MKFNVNDDGHFFLICGRFSRAAFLTSLDPAAVS